MNLVTVNLVIPKEVNQTGKGWYGIKSSSPGELGLSFYLLAKSMRK